MKQGQSWRFDGKEGSSEIRDRAIGRHELAAVAVCKVTLPLNWNTLPRTGTMTAFSNLHRKSLVPRVAKMGCTGALVTAAHPALGPFLAEAVEAVKDAGGPKPLAGYYFKVLARQGSTPAGARGIMLSMEIRFWDLP